MTKQTELTFLVKTGCP